MPRLALTAYTRYGIIFFDELELCPKGDNLASFVKAKRREQGWTQVQLADYAGTGKKARIDGGNFRVFAKTIGLNERQTDHAFSRIADSVEANLGDVLAVSLLSDAFTTRFKRLVRANLDWLVARRE